MYSTLEIESLPTYFLNLTGGAHTEIAYLVGANDQHDASFQVMSPRSGHRYSEDEINEFVGLLNEELARGRFVHPCKVNFANHTTLEDDMEVNFKAWLAAAMLRDLGALVQMGVLTINPYQKAEHIGSGEQTMKIAKAYGVQATTKYLVGAIGDEALALNEVHSDGGLFHDMFLFFPWSDDLAVKMLAVFRDCAVKISAPQSVAEKLPTTWRSDGQADKLCHSYGVSVTPHASGRKIEIGEDCAEDFPEYPWNLAVELSGFGGAQKLRNLDGALTELLRKDN